MTRLRYCLLAILALASCLNHTTPSISLPTDGAHVQPVAPTVKNAQGHLSVEELLANAVPSAVYHRNEIPFSENAFADWDQAARLYDVAAQQEPKLADLTRDTASSNQPFPRGKKGKLLSNWLNRQQSVLALVDRVATRERLQLPPLPLNADGPEWTLSPWRALANLKTVRAKRFAAQGNWEAAARDIWDIVHIGSMLAAGDAELIRYLVGNAVQFGGLRRLQWLARNRDLSTPVLTDLVDRMSQAPDFCGIWAKALRVEFTQFWVPSMSHYDLDAVLKELAQGASQERIDLVHELLGEHPDPFDLAQTVHLLSESIHREGEACTLPWKEANSTHTDPFTPSAAEDVLNQLISGESTPSPDAISRTAKELRAVPNPIGRLLVRQHSVDYVSRVFSLQAEWRATRLVLLIELYRRHTGSLPDSLADLVLPQKRSAVLDPFSGEPFRYSRDRTLLWSVGVNGQDDNGHYDTCDPVKMTKGSACLAVADDVAWSLKLAPNRYQRGNTSTGHQTGPNKSIQATPRKPRRA